MPSPVLAAHTFGFVWQANAEEAIAALGEAGFRHVELMATPPHFDPWRDDPEEIRRIRTTLEKHGMTLLALDLASSDINLASPSRNVVDFAVDAYGRAAARGAELGARWLCVGSGRRHALLSHVNGHLMATFRPAFDRICAEARRLGLGVMLENHPQGLLAEARAIKAFLTAPGYDDVGVIYDVANAFAIGEDPVAGLETLWSRVGIVHLSDSPRGAWRHDSIGSGDIDFADIANLMRRRGFGGAVVLEILSDRPMEGLLDGVARLRAAGLMVRDIRP
jgi:sugar phosphate isomerase/epimerase